MAVFSRQVGTELRAWKEIARYRALGHWTNEPHQVIAPNQRDLVWSMTVSVVPVREEIK
mgnify:CR=1 FL=1